MTITELQSLSDDELCIRVADILRPLSVRDSKLRLEADDQLATLLVENAPKIVAMLEAADSAVVALAIARAEVERLSKNTDKLINHCNVCECEECSRIVCPHGEPLHLHHDGCPACVVYDEKNLFPTEEAIAKTTQAISLYNKAKETP